ncbi:MAG: hypothetical protein IJY82_05265 [Oscillospiraceae bacterium]|nr:hypothetical protein [Oscillospiraceae bacterium]MBQ8732220.1 hypothetical protein [Oscillospiraceae bacterium]
MNSRENALAILNYEKHTALPVVSFGYWPETTEKWCKEGYITKEESDSYIHEGDNSVGDQSIMKKLGFDFNWNSCIPGKNLFDPPIPGVVLEEKEDGSQIIRDGFGLICRVRPGTVSIPEHIGTALTGREAWEELYLPRLQMHADRVNREVFAALPAPADRSYPIGFHAGSLIGQMRNMLGVEELSYLYVDDEELYVEIVDTICGLGYEVAKGVMETGVTFDYAHFWEDICYKNGPLVSPAVFEELIGPWYKKMTDLFTAHGIKIVSVDCDGWIDSLVPIWLENGVNTMFPIEVGTWGGNIGDWRAKYGPQIRGVGGMNKNVFSRDKKAVEEEIERLKKLIDLGGYLPCPDHRIAPDAKFELVAYYCELLRKLS